MSRVQFNLVLFFVLACIQLQSKAHSFNSNSYNFLSSFFKAGLHSLPANHLFSSPDAQSESDEKLYVLPDNVEQEIRSVLYELNVKDPDSICLCAQFFKPWAFSFILDDERYICINLDWFYSLTKAERRFVIAHEAMHLHFNHGYKEQKFLSEKKKVALCGLAITIAALGVAYKCMTYVIDPSKDPYNFSSSCIMGSIFGFMPLFLTLSWKYDMYKFQQNQEVEADQEACLRLGTCLGALRCLKRFIYLDEEFERNLSEGYVILRTSHPAPKYRFELMQDLQKQSHYDVDIQSNTYLKRAEELVQAINYNNLADVKKALQKGANANAFIDGDPVLAIAIKGNANVSIIRELLVNKANICVTDSEGDSIAKIAANSKNLEIIQLLLDFITDPSRL